MTTQTGVLNGHPIIEDSTNPGVALTNSVVASNAAVIANASFASVLADSGNFVSPDATVTKVVKITQSAYDDLAPPDPYTLYIITV